MAKHRTFGRDANDPAPDGPIPSPEFTHPEPEINPAELDPEPELAAADPPRELTIVLRQARKVGEFQRDAGFELAKVTLFEGVDLNFVVDAIRGGIAGEKVT
jgi:hypothetical protein